jgi:hypothetical protein
MKKKNLGSMKDRINLFQELSEKEAQRLGGGSEKSSPVKEIYIAPPPPGTIGGGVGIRF